MEIAMKSPMRKMSQDFWEKGDDDDDDEARRLCVECQKSTSSICLKCDGAGYCRQCFDKIHSNGCMLKQHKLQAAVANFGIDNCAKHNQARKNSYCRRCAQPICEECRRDHHGHEVTALVVQVLFAELSNGFTSKSASVIIFSFLPWHRTIRHGRTSRSS